ncbi:hypothetical protein [uncultured Arcticibacterium sp.]|uniref:nuclear transport factor 2 family protein n=1 Tax=uncultured Arcticibacterium sp. TaxID=2173042 RepID=UPI0030FA0B94
MIQKTNLNYLAYFVGFACIIGLTSCSKKIVYKAPVALSNDYISSLPYEKKLAYWFVTAPKTESDTADTLISDTFYSRDQNWGGGKETYLKRRNSDLSFSQIEPIRILQDDSLVAIHSRMIGDTLRFRWDIMLIEQKKIQKHWSNVNDSLGVNPDNHSEIDGPTIPSQLEKTANNRSLIARFIDQCMIREDGGASKFFNFGLYTQHNRDVGDGVSGLLWGMLRMKRKGEVIKFKNNYHIVAEGNLVLSATEGYVANEKMAFYDLFRIEKNKIVEHWDIIAPIKTFINTPNR